MFQKKLKVRKILEKFEKGWKSFEKKMKKGKDVFK